MADNPTVNFDGDLPPTPTAPPSPAAPSAFPNEDILLNVDQADLDHDSLVTGNPHDVRKSDLGLEVSTTLTPAPDLRGANTTALSPFVNFRPAFAEPTPTVTARTAAIQAAVEAKSLAGGGVVWLPEGVLTVNEIVMRSRITLAGAGYDRTSLLAGPEIGDGDAILISENFAANVAIYNDDLFNSPKWLIDGSPMRITLRDFTIDGNGRNGLTSGTSVNGWDMDLEKPNEAKNNVGIAMYCTGLRIERVRVLWCSGRGIEIYRGRKPLTTIRTPLDTAESFFRDIICQGNGGDGMWCGNFSDGVIENYTSLGNEGWGLVLNGSNWNCTLVHTYGNKLGGVQSNEGGIFGIMQCESEQGPGWENNGSIARVSNLILYQNNRNAALGKASCVANKRILVALAEVEVGPFNINSTGMKGFEFNALANGSYVNGYVNVRSSGVHSNATIFEDNTTNGGLKLNMIGGWGSGQPGITLLKKSNGSPKNRLIADINNNVNPMTMVDGEIHSSDRFEITHPTSAVQHINVGSGEVVGSASYESIPV